MKSINLTTCIALLIGLFSIQLRSETNDINTVEDFLNSPISLNVEAAEAISLIDPSLTLIPLWQKFIEVDSDLSPQKDGLSRCYFNVDNLKTKYLLAWVIHFANARGEIVKNKIYIQTPQKLPKSDPVFECYKETEGDWPDALSKTLETKTVSCHVNNIHVTDAIRMLQRIADINMIIHPELFYFNESFSSNKVSFVGKNVPAGEFLKNILDQTGLRFKLQGGVVFITKKQEKSLRK